MEQEQNRLREMNRDRVQRFRARHGPEYAAAARARWRVQAEARRAMLIDLARQLLKLLDAPKA
jgi:hypothetical protein